MLNYYLRMAWKSLRRTPGLSLLMISGIGLGISACIVTLTVFHAMSGNPIWWKNRVLYAVTLDSRSAHARIPKHRGTRDELNYRDATYLFTSRIPKHRALMTLLMGAVTGAPGQSRPMSAAAPSRSGSAGQSAHGGAISWRSS